MTDWKSQLEAKYGYPSCGMIEVGDGWRPIVEAFYDLIERSSNIISAAQVKEKFGTIRMYVDAEYEESNEALAGIVFAKIDALEVVSKYTCESCGAYGSLRTVRSWHKTLCDRCDEKHP